MVNIGYGVHTTCIGRLCEKVQCGNAAGCNVYMDQRDMTQIDKQDCRHL